MTDTTTRHWLDDLATTMMEGPRSTWPSPAEVVDEVGRHLEQLFEVQLLRLTLDLFMASDPTPLRPDVDDRLADLLSDACRRLGFDGWVDAYHRLPRSTP